MNPRWWIRWKVKRDEDFDLFLERRGEHGRRVYEWHRWLWAIDPAHPMHAFGVQATQGDLFA